MVTLVGHVQQCTICLGLLFDSIFRQIPRIRENLFFMRPVFFLALSKFWMTLDAFSE